ncbi:MAG: histidine kinase [Muribaculaceae bacterium]|nr:histidine kinase [Muribaculaceae bacterium]MBQ5409590.1 histidine kinase [Muribaculaceae bacterium]MBQ5508287.1 histidine kinase [Muribaculaceae bacterium]MDY6411516.1 histidine kinase [Bacteroidales bacterium]
MGKKNLINRTVLIHFLCWGLVLAFPLFFYHPTDPLEVTLKHYVRSLSGPLGYMIVFYVNYFYLVPKFLFENKRNQFFLFNVILIFLTVSLMTWWWHMFSTIFAESFNRPRMGFNAPPKWVRFMQLALMLVLVIGLCVAVRMSQRMSQLHAAKKEAERTRTEAELKNLRNQLNPHFLLNTLNNIYALIAFDPDKAQMAVGELSKLLRHALYDNQKKFVPLYKEVEFIKNYIELMKIRVTNNVKINSQIDVDNEDSTPIAPLIFISLIENAFKHGVSQAGMGQIYIHLANRDDKITCEIRNTNYPKRDNDKSGSGIGLEQVGKRLELIYKDHYTWEKGIDAGTNEYYSKIVLDNDNKVRHN